MERITTIPRERAVILESSCSPYLQIMYVHDHRIWAVAKYLAELDFRARVGQGQSPESAWGDVRTRLSEFLDPIGFNSSYFDPEMKVLERQLKDAESRPLSTGVQS